MSFPIVTQPGFPAAKRDWHDGLFDCTNDCHSCWCITCCYICYMCQMYKRYDECCATPMAMFFPGLTLRVYHRARHNIEGTIFHDCLLDYCCTFCAACQLDRDMKFVEQTKGWCIACCYMCYMCHMYKRYDECCATPMAILFPGLPLRVYHRAKQNIDGTIFHDCLLDYCCTFCAACQLDRDMKFVEQTKGILNV